MTTANEKKLAALRVEREKLEAAITEQEKCDAAEQKKLDDSESDTEAPPRGERAVRATTPVDAETLGTLTDQMRRLRREIKELHSSVERMQDRRGRW